MGGRENSLSGWKPNSQRLSGSWDHEAEERIAEERILEGISEAQCNTAALVAFWTAIFSIIIGKVSAAFEATIMINFPVMSPARRTLQFNHSRRCHIYSTIILIGNFTFICVEVGRMVVGEQAFGVIGAMCLNLHHFTIANNECH